MDRGSRSFLQNLRVLNNPWVERTSTALDGFMKQTFRNKCISVLKVLTISLGPVHFYFIFFTYTLYYTISVIRVTSHLICINYLVFGTSSKSFRCITTILFFFHLMQFLTCVFLTYLHSLTLLLSLKLAIIDSTLNLNTPYIATSSPTNPFAHLNLQLTVLNSSLLHTITFPLNGDLYLLFYSFNIHINSRATYILLLTILHSNNYLNKVSLALYRLPLERGDC